MSGRPRHEEILTWRAGWTRVRYDALADALRSFLPRWSWAAPSGGLTIWARLPDDADSSAFAQAALRRGVAVVPAACSAPRAAAARTYGWPSPAA